MRTGQGPSLLLFYVGCCVAKAFSHSGCLTLTLYKGKQWRPNIPSMLQGVQTGTHDAEEFIDTGFDLMFRKSNKCELS